MSLSGFFTAPSRWFLALFAVVLVTGTRLCATLPEPWSDADIGTVGTAGGSAYDSATGTYTVQGAGADIGGTADNLHFTYRPLSGDGYIVARIASLTNTNSSAKAGVMIRETLDANARNALMMVTPGTGAGIKWRTSIGATSSQVLVTGIQAPRWVKLERRGKMVTGYESADGVTWNVVQRVALSMTADVYVGLAACSRTSALTTVVADHVVVDVSAAGLSLPWPWVEDTVGAPADAGAALYDGSYVLSNLGADITGTADKMKYVSQTLTGDGTLTVKVSSVTSADNATRFGLMVRETLDANSRNVLLGLTTAKSVVFMSRRTAGGTLTSRATSVTVAVPAWLRLERSGNVFTAWRSADGVNWTVHGTETLDLGPTLHVGLAYSNRSGSTWAIGVGDELRLTSPADADGNGLADAWEMQYFGHTGVDPLGDPDGDGLTNNQEWELGNDPLVFNLEGQRPLLELVGGNNQTGVAGTVLPQPLVVRVKDSLSGDPLANIPVLMRVTQGEGLLGSTAPGVASLNLFSDANGLVQSSFFLPGTAVNTVSASIGGRQQAGMVTFTLNAQVGAESLRFNIADLGSPALTGRAPYADGTFTLSGANVINNAGVSDNSTFVWRDFTGDGCMLVRTAFVDATDPYAQAGVMIRASLDANAPNAAMLLTLANGVAFQWRDTAGGSTGVIRKSGVSGPVWLLLRRAGDTFTGFYSTNGQVWSVLGTRTLPMDATVKVGLTLGTKTTVYNRATFDGLRLAPLSESPWLMADVGLPGATAVDDYADDSIFVRAGGTDISGTADAFHYIYQPLVGDGRLITRVASQYATATTAKSSLMIRESLSPDSRHVTLMLTPGSGVTLRARSATGGTTVTLGNIPAVAAPYWLRLDRLGGHVDAYASTDGVAWTLVGSTAFDPGATPFIGLAASSNNTTAHTRTLFEHLQLEMANGVRGWNGAYFEGTAFDIPRVFRRDTEIDFTWPATQSPAPGVPAQGYSVRWEGDLVPAYSETYTFTALSQGSARVTVNGQVIVDRWTAHALSEAAGSVALQAGHPVRVVVDYANASGDGRIQLRWSSPGQPDEPVPFTSVQAIDADDDGMPDTWETAHGLNLRDPADAALDPDGDGLNNLQEYLLGGNLAVADDRLPGAVTLEEWTGITGTKIFNLTRDAKFHALADTKRAVTLLETAKNHGDNYGQRLRGYLVPPADGDYQFWVSADESAELWLSPDDSPFTRVKIARLTEGATAYRTYTTRVEQHSGKITLQAGRHYYFEVLHKEGTGSDHLSVAWTRPGVTSPEVITGAFLALFAGHPDDLDGDGLPDAWETLHGLGDTSLTPAARGACGDADGDRLANLLEYQRGTDPLNPDTDGDGHDDYLEILAASDPLAMSDLNLAPWQLADVGLVNGLAIANRIGADAFQMAGTGSGLIQHEPDAFRFLYRQIPGDFELTTRLVRPASSPVGYGGVTVRSSLDPQAASFTVFQNANGGNRLYVRSSDNADLVELPSFTPAYGSEASSLAGDWLRLRREGDLVRFYYSADGRHWMLAATKTLALGGECLVGTAVCRSLDIVTGTADTELPVRQFKDMRLVTDLTPPASPETVPPEATATVIATINGSAGVTVAGQWAAVGTNLVSQVFTGTLDYAFTVPADGLYRLTFTALSTSNRTTSTLFPVEISVDGQFVARVDLVLPLTEEGLARVIAPWLKAGAHTVRLFYDNTLSYHPLTIRSLTVEQLGGVDTDANGRADWVDERLQALNTIDAGDGGLYVSPASLDGKVRHRSLFALTAGGRPVAVNPAPGFGWYADVPLSETDAVEVVGDFENSGSVQGLLLAWTPLNLLGLPEEYAADRRIRIRKGDSLRFTAFNPATKSGGEAALVIQAPDATVTRHAIRIKNPKASSGNQGANGSNLTTQPAVHAFSRAGVYTVTGVFTETNKSPVASGAFTVEVIEAAFASDPVVGLNNTPITWDNPLIFDNVLLEIDQGLLLVKKADLAGGGTRFSLADSNVADSYIVARLGEGGPVLGHATVHSLRAATVSDTAMDLLQAYSDGSILYGVPVIVNRLTDDTAVKISITTQGVTFDDGTIVKTLTKADFDEYGRIYLKFIYPAGVSGSICHVVQVYEGATYLGQF